MSYIARGALVGLAVIFLMSVVPASALIATDLLTLKLLAQGRLTGGDLTGKQEKAVESLLKKIGKAEGTDPVQDAAKHLKRTAKVVAAVGKVEGKDVSLGDGAGPLLVSLADEVATHEASTAELRDLLLVEKDRKEIDKHLTRGRTQLASADEQPTDAKRAKKLAQAAKTFVKALARGRKLLDREIENGQVTFEIVGTTLDANPVLEAEGTVMVEFNLTPSLGSLTGAFVLFTERRPDDPAGPGETHEALAEPGDGPTIVIIRPPVPLAPGTHYLVIHGLDSDLQDGVKSESYPLTLETTLVVEFTVAGE